MQSVGFNLCIGVSAASPAAIVVQDEHEAFSSNCIGERSAKRTRV